MTGMIAKAKMFNAVRRCAHSPSVPRKPSARALKKVYLQPVERSRAMARSGMSGRKRYMVEESRYVVMASRSQERGEWKFGHRFR